MDSSITLDIQALTEIAHYAHWIPANKGLTDKWMSENYPEWGWSDFIPGLIAQKIICAYVDNPDYIPLKQQLYIKREIKSVTVIRINGAISYQIQLWD
jgi:hypothetical protein